MKGFEEAMHMADALISPAVGLTMAAVGVAAVGVSVARVKSEELGENKVPIMGVAGAMVFAAQMINFTIPGTGSSGHIGGGILLAGLLGGGPAFLSIAAVLIIQCLFFADGGLLALGCNIFNLGVIPCLVVYPLVFRNIMKGGASYRRLSAASVVSAVIGLALGAFCVVIQTLLSGVTQLPFGAFSALMLPIHLAIGLVEGVVTAAVLCFIYRMRPEIIDSAQSGKGIDGVSAKEALLALAALAIIAGGALSLFASSKPDGLEWAVEKTAERAVGDGIVPEAEGGVFQAASSVQESTAFMPDYAFEHDSENAAGTSTAGLVGAVCTFALAGAVGFVITKIKKRKASAANA